MKDLRRWWPTGGCCVTLKSEDGVKYELRFEDPALDDNPLALEGSLAEIAGELRRIANWVLPLPTVFEVDLEGSWKEPVVRREPMLTIEQGRELWEKLYGERTADWYPPTGTHCSDCGEPQYATPGGRSCKNGHGGAPPKEG